MRKYQLYSRSEGFEVIWNCGTYESGNEERRDRERHWTWCVCLSVFAGFVHAGLASVIHHLTLTPPVVRLSPCGDAYSVHVGCVSLRPNLMLARAFPAHIFHI